MTRRLLLCLATAASSLTAAVLPGATHAQSGSGTTGAAVLQFAGGGRAAALGGAYTAAADIDVLFYNPAGAARLAASASASYQRHVEDIGFVTAAAALRIRGVSAGIALGHLDYGTIAEVRPDPAFAGQRGLETGESVGASETAARMMLAAPLIGRRLLAGASAGLLLVRAAETARAAAVFDAGLQYLAGDGLTLAAALRNAGADIEGALMAPAPMPTELRFGAAYDVPGAVSAPLLVRLSSDAILPTTDQPAALAAGAEATIGGGGRGPAGSLRAGYNGAVGSTGVGRVHFGAGLTMDSFALDYAFQDMGMLGAVHRFGVRWSR
jgi:hypothetical protein